MGGFYTRRGDLAIGERKCARVIAGTYTKSTFKNENSIACLSIQAVYKRRICQTKKIGLND